MRSRMVRRPGRGAGAPVSCSQRLAASVALLAFAAVVAVLIARLIDRPIALPVSVVAVTITLMAGWAALVGRGPRRLGAAVLAVCTLGALIAFAGVIGLATLLVTAGLLVMSGIAARGAFGRHRPRGRRVGAARHGVLVVNPRSGAGAAGRHQLAQAALRRGIEVVTLTEHADLRSLAEDAADRGADVVGMAGGDGSQAVVADVARRRGMAFVCVPAGTRNHFALDLGLDRRDVVGALDAFDLAVEQRVDLGQLGDRVFVNNVSLGVYADIVQSDSYRDAKVPTAAARLPDLLGADRAAPDLRFTGPDGHTGSTADVLLVSNNAYQLHSLGGFGTRPHLDSGQLGVTTLCVDRARDLPALVALESMGAISRFRGFQQWTSPTLRIDSARPVSVGVDGEALCLPPPLELRSLPAAVGVRIPVHAPGVPPARPGLWGMFPALVRIVAGRSPA